MANARGDFGADHRCTGCRRQSGRSGGRRIPQRAMFCRAGAGTSRRFLRRAERCSGHGAEARWRRKGATRLLPRTERFGQLEQAFANLRVADAVVGSHQLQRFPSRQRIRFERRLRLIGRRQAPRDRRPCTRSFMSSKKKETGTSRMRLNSNSRDGADAVGAALVLLHLLERQADGLAQFLLAEPEQGAPQPHPAANVNVDGIRDALAATHRRCHPARPAALYVCRSICRQPFSVMHFPRVEPPVIVCL